jgi:protocatechuate 3,4-dioxygenase beta subunit
MTASPRATAIVAVFGAFTGVIALDARQQSRDALPSLPVGTATITGRVVTDDDSARPIRGAVVTVSLGPLDALKQLAITDDNGRFAVLNLPAGEFYVDASKPGYVDAYYGTREASSRGARAGVEVADGEQKTVSLQLARGAVIAGRILDVSGRPQRDVSIRAIRVKTFGDQRVQNPTPPTGREFGMTDETGTYRLYGLAPGDYVVSATINGQVEAAPIRPEEIRWAESLAQQPAQSGSAPAPPRAAAPMGYAPVFYPGSSDPATATTVTLAKGEERDGVDFSLLPVALARIEGTLVDASGRPVSGVEISLQTNQATPWLSPIGGGGIPASRTDATGTFRFSRVLPGTYTLLGRTAPAGMWARDTVIVNGSDQFGATLRLQGAVSISGRLIVDADTPPDLKRVTLNLASVSGVVQYGTPGARPDADGGFAFRGIIPGRYRLVAFVAPPPGGTPASGPAQWALESVTVAGVDAMDAGLEISGADVPDIVATLTDRRSELSGTLRDAAGRPVGQELVVAFSTDRTLWTAARRVSGTGTDQNGRYLIAWLRPGVYFLAGSPDGDVRQLSNPSFLDSLIPDAVKVTIAEGEKKTQDLKLSGGSPD